MKREVSSNARTDGKARTGQPGREINREESRENSGKAFEICNRHLPAPVYLGFNIYYCQRAG